MPLSENKREIFSSLFREFLVAYPSSAAGIKHRTLYKDTRKVAQENYQLIADADKRGDDITELVILKLLPYADTSNNNAKGAWIHWAPSIIGDLRKWYENKGWVHASQWSTITAAIWVFIQKCNSEPEMYETACQEFIRHKHIGFQTGTLTPILNALHPDKFALINKKPQLTINYLTEQKLGTSLAEYPELNRTAFQVVDELAEDLNDADLGITPGDLFDMFCHWLVAVRKFEFPEDFVPESEPGTDFVEEMMGAPFDVIFVDRAEAEWAFDFLEKSMMLLGVEGPNDKRCTLTLPKKYKRNLLRFNFTNAVVIDFKGSKIKGGRGVDLALLEHHVIEGYPRWGTFRTFSEPTTVYELPFDVVRNMSPELQALYEETFQYLGHAKAGFAGGPFQHANQQEILDAIFDHEKRQDLLDQGLPDVDLAEDDLDLDIDGKPIDPPALRPYTLADCVADTGFAEATLLEWHNAITDKGQGILYGPPGTGKTYLAERLARLLTADGDGFIELIQFHPSYAYEDFIQGIRPQTTTEGQLVYRTVPGRFLEFCRSAQQCTDTCVLIIDEINRANLSRVFGELMYLLEYRDRDIPLAGGGKLQIPANVRILGTMNTADRSIALVDHALRRRFVFIALPPNLERLRDYHSDPADQLFINALIKVLERLNQRIQDRNYAVGTSYFLRHDLRQALPTVWRMEIEPYLEEYFFAQKDRLDEFRWHKIHAELGV